MSKTLGTGFSVPSCTDCTEKEKEARASCLGSHGKIERRCRLNCRQRHLVRGFYSKPQPDCFGDGNKRGEAWVTVLRQGSIETLTLDPSGLGNFGDTVSLCEMTQRDRRRARLHLPRQL